MLFNIIVLAYVNINNYIAAYIYFIIRGVDLVVLAMKNNDTELMSPTTPEIVKEDVQV
jgi:hypothetical protein